MSGTNVLFDLLSSPPNFNYYSLLREEVEATFAKEEDWKDHANLAKLTHMDSAIRETLRMNPVLSRLTLREVISPKGLDLPSGHHLAKGTWVGIPAVSVHQDERFYHAPHIYSPFRFVKKPQTYNNPETDTKGIDLSADAEKKPGQTPEQKFASYRKPEMLATASDTYLAFGYGRHSCPGRWFVASQLKLLFAYIVAHYDFEPLETRPLSKAFGDSILPSSTTKVKVRRRSVGDKVRN